MNNAIFQDLWRGAEGAEALCALRCGEVSVSYGDFFREILRAEAGLRRLGVQAGELVSILSLNTPETIAAFYAIDRIGAVANWVDMKATPQELGDCLRLANSKVVLALELAFDKVYQSRENTPVEHLVCLPIARYLAPALAEKLHLGGEKTAGKEGCLSWEAFLQEPDGAEPETTRWEEPAVITYTGGTTGPAKGVVLSRRAFHASLNQYVHAGTEYGRGGAALTLLPPFAMFGLCQCIHVPLCLGMTVILSPLFLPHQLGELLVRYRPEQVNATSSYWQLLLRSKEAEGADLSFLKVPRNGGDGMAAEMERRINRFLQERGCEAKLIKEYGMSEAGGIVCLNYGGSHEIGSVGQPLEGTWLCIVDPDTGEPLEEGEQGEILISAPTQMNGYYNRAGEDDAVLKPGPGGLHWVWTKDIGYRNERGDLFVTGRKKRMISRNGFKIFPSNIEECLLGQAEVADCAVVGGEMPNGETRPVAHVVLREGADRGEMEEILRKKCKKELNFYTVPAAYVFWESLPLTERGKVDYRLLETRSVGLGE